MKKKMMALLLGITIAFSYTTTAFADVSDTQNEKASLTSALVGDLSTAKQEDEKKKYKDVDEDIRESVNEQIPEELEEIEISSADDLIKLADDCKLDIWSVNKKVVLTQDISLIGKNFKGIPTFGGIFDGQGHTISDSYIENGISYTGLFCNVQETGIIQNLNVHGAVRPTGDQTFVGGIAGSNSGLIIGCSFKGVVQGKDYVGGITGMNALTGVINDCTAEGYIHGVHFTGGVAGENMGYIINCANKTDVNTSTKDTKISIDAMTNINKLLSVIKNNDKTPEEANTDNIISDTGGIAGLSIGIISKCINDGVVGYEHVGYNVGGIAGRQSGYVLSCSNNGKIQGRKDIAGIVGQAEPYITLDLSTDVTHKLSEEINKLHDTVNVTLKDAKKQSNILSGRIAKIQQFTAGAIDDVGYLSNGTVDYANGVSGAASEAFSRVDYIMEEASKKDGVIDQANYAISNVQKSTEDIRKAINDIDLDRYLTESEKVEYENAKLIMDSSVSQYSEIYDNAYTGYYNHEIADDVSRKITGDENKDLVYVTEYGEVLRVEDYNYDKNWLNKAVVEDDLKAMNGVYNEHGILTEGNWYHENENGELSPLSESNEADRKLLLESKGLAAAEANRMAKELYESPLNNGNDLDEDLSYAASVYSEVTSRHLEQMKDELRSDASRGLNELNDAAENLKSAGQQTKGILSNVSGRPDIAFPQFSDEYKLHTSSLTGNLQGMNDNFGLLNQELKNASGNLLDDIQAMTDQFNSVMLLFTDAIDDVMQGEHTIGFEDISQEEAEKCMDATIDSCSNFGIVEGDINVAGVSGAMAIEYDFDLESEITALRDAKLNSSFLTKCVLRDNNNYGEIVGEKDYVGGICGLQELGTILGNGNYANVSSSSGDYVGGVAGSSLSYVVSSFSRGIISGRDYVGGVAGNGVNIKDCFSMVDIPKASSWYGAIAGHASDKGQIRNNYFVSDTLAGIDRISYVEKAQPISYEDSTDTVVFEEDSREIPYEFSYLNVSFMLDDEDKGEPILLAKERKNYGEKLSVSDYPLVPNKDGFYATWDIEEVDGIETDMVITAKYNRYLTTLAEEDYSKELHQSQLLVDGMFKEGDELEVTRSENFSIDVEFLEKLENGEEIKDILDNGGAFESIHLIIPDDGKMQHQVRYLPFTTFYAVNGDFTLSAQNGDVVKVIEPTGKMGDYKTFDITGNDVMLYISYDGIKNQAYKYIGIAVAALLVFLILVVLTIISAGKHGKRLPKLFDRIKTDVSKKIESKEQIFYNDEEDEKKEKKDTEEKRTDNVDNKDGNEKENESEVTDNEDIENKSEVVEKKEAESAENSDSENKDKI